VSDKNPYLYENTVRVLDEAVYNWLGTFHVDYGEMAGVPRNDFPILRVFASPQRALADVSDLLVRQNWIAGDSPELQKAKATNDWSVLPLPIVTIERDDPIRSNELANTAGVWRNMGFNQATGEFQSHEYPLHFLTQYRFNFWCEKQYTRALFVEWILNQTGLRGAWPNEFFIPIKHPEPWGVQLHQMRYTGSENLSDLEGDDARHIRQLYSFILRSWAFRKPKAAPIIYTKQQDFHADLTVSGDLDRKNDAGWWSTDNLFSLKMWPAQPYGMASVSSSDGLSVQSKVALETDGVLFTRATSTPDAFGASIWMISATAVSERPWTLVFSGSDGDSDSAYEAGRLAVPAGQQKFHKFFIATTKEAGVAVQGANAETTVSLSDIDFRQIAERPRLVPTGLAPNADTVGFTDYFFTGLKRDLYLVIALFDKTLSPDIASDIAIVSDDSVAPDNTITAAYGIPDSNGVVLPIMPKSSSVRLTIRSDVRFTRLYAIPFDGYVKDSTV
jgi:hypothetical protein